MAVDNTDYAAWVNECFSNNWYWSSACLLKLINPLSGQTKLPKVIHSSTANLSLIENETW